MWSLIFDNCFTRVRDADAPSEEVSGNGVHFYLQPGGLIMSTNIVLVPLKDSPATRIVWPDSSRHRPVEQELIPADSRQTGISRELFMKVIMESWHQRRCRVYADFLDFSGETMCFNMVHIAKTLNNVE